MPDKISVIAKIRPGKRDDLERLLEKGPPFDLDAEGFERHEVFLGDTDVVFIFTGPGAVAHLERMAASRALFTHVLKMTGLVSAPRVLNQMFEWHREGQPG
ncbi:MAG TPA: hypothetical protein VGL44_07240 [Gaiellales bacterium]|jgi:hypothetical protein